MNSIIRDSLKDIFAYFTINQLLCFRQVCKLWKRNIESLPARFESLHVSQDPEECPFLIKYIHNFLAEKRPDLIIPQPFHARLKTMIFSCSTGAAVSVLRPNSELLANIESIKLTTWVDFPGAVDELIWIFRKYGQKITELRLTLDALINTPNIIRGIKDKVSSKCRIWIRLESLDLNYAQFDKLKDDKRLDGFVDCYHTTLTNAILIRDLVFYVKHLKEMSLSNFYFHEHIMDYKEIQKELEVCRPIITSAVVRLSNYTYAQLNMTDKLANYLESAPNLQTLEIYWTEGNADAIHLGSVSDRISSLFLRIQYDSKVSLASRLVFKSFQKLKMFGCHMNSYDYHSLYLLLRAMPSLDRLELLLGYNIESLGQVEDICRATCAHYIHIVSVGLNVKDALQQKEFKVQDEGKTTSYYVYHISYSGIIFIRKCVEVCDAKVVKKQKIC